MKKLLFAIVLGFAALAHAADCPVPGSADWTAGKRWCKTQDASNTSTRFLDRAWNKLVWDKDDRQMHAWFQSADAPVTFSNAIGHYALLTSPGTVTSNKWTMDTFCGDTNTNGYNTRQEPMHLNADLGTGDAPFTMQIGITAGDNGAIGQKPIPQTGHVYVGDEMFAYDSCTSADGTGTCQVAEHGPITLHITARAQRSNAGWLASATAHLVTTGEETSFACPGPFGVGNDHPLANHPYGNLTYDTTRGRLWWNNGTMESWQMRNTWYRCLHSTASCTDLTQGWQKVPLVASGGTGLISAENVTIYAPVADALLNFGGTRSGSPLNTVWIFCLSANSTWVDSTHTCASSGYVNNWKQITPHGGAAFAIQGVRGAYDSDHNKALFFNGNVGATKYPVVQVYDPASGDWCLSTTAYGGSNASSCPAGFGTAAADPPPGQRFAMWTYDKRHHKGVFLCCSGGPNGRVYQYDDVANTWAYTDIDTDNAPVIDSNSINGVDWQYADESSAGAGDDMLVALVPAYISGNTFVEMYQLPAAALDTGSGPTTYTYSITVAGTGTGSVSDGAGFTCSTGTCTHSYDEGTAPTFTATPSGGGSFAGWSAGSGDLAACTGTGTCSGAASQTSGVTATFNPPAPSAATTFTGMTVSGMEIQ